MDAERENEERNDSKEDVEEERLDEDIKNGNIVKPIKSPSVASTFLFRK